jgi:hypothetical protein
MDFAAPSGYLAYGNLSHEMSRNKLCDICHRPLITINPVQLRHEGECMKEGRLRARGRRLARIMLNRPPSTAKRGRPRKAEACRT